MTRVSLFGIVALALAPWLGCAKDAGGSEEGAGGEGDPLTSPAGGGGGASATCGDGECLLDETCADCPEDCGDCADCGNRACDPGETCSSCAMDCGACSPDCGDAHCSGNETCTNCPDDCGMCPDNCGDGMCGPSEQCSDCPEDCGACACMADAFEPNEHSPQAKAVASGTHYCDLSVCDGDVDWLKFPVSSGFTATMTFQNALGDLDLEIYDADTVLYVTGSYSHVADGESVNLSGLSAGTYWARIYGYKGAQNSAYCFQVDTF